MMSDNITLAEQRECAVLEGEDEMYIVDIFSCVKPGEHHDYNESHKQLLLYITRAVGNNRSTFLQEEKAKLGMVRVYSDKFCWKKTQRAGTLFAIMEMGDFQAVKTVEKMKIDEMRLPEKVTYTLPPCNASNMKVVTKLLCESLGGNTLLETEQLNVPLSIIPKKEPKPGVEHDYISSHTTELSLTTRHSYYVPH